MTIVSPVPNTFAPGTTIISGQVNANFTSIVNDVNTNAAHNGANSDITSIAGLTTPLSLAQGGTAYYVGGTTGGSGTTQTLSAPSPAYMLSAGNLVSLIAGVTNTGSLTLNINSTGAISVVKRTTSGLAALAAGDWVANQPYQVYYNGSQYVMDFPSTALSAGVTSLTVTNATNGGIAVTSNGTTGGVTVTLGLKPSDLATKSSPATSDSILIMDAAASNAPKTATIAKILSLATSTGTVTTGTTLSMNPYATATTSSGNHSLGSVPAILDVYLVCLTGELGYSAGDEVPLDSGRSGGNTSYNVSASATQVFIATTSNAVAITDRSLNTAGNITPANWKLVVVPRKIN